MLDSIPASSSASACRSAPSNRSVTPDIAETTASTGRCAFRSVQMAAATGFFSGSPRWCRRISQQDDFSLSSFTPVGGPIADDFQNGRFHFINAEPGSVHINGVRRLHQGRLRASPVTLIAFTDLFLHLVRL